MSKINYMLTKEQQENWYKRLTKRIQITDKNDLNKLGQKLYSFITYWKEKIKHTNKNDCYPGWYSKYSKIYFTLENVDYTLYPSALNCNDTTFVFFFNKIEEDLEELGATEISDYEALD